MVFVVLLLKMIVGKLYKLTVKLIIVQFSVQFCRKGVSMDTLDTPLDPPLYYYTRVYVHHMN